MEDWVHRALARWPNVPALYGWLGLDRRGRWLIRGETISRPQIVDIPPKQAVMAGLRLTDESMRQVSTYVTFYIPLAAALVEGDADTAAALAQELADRPGAIVPVHAANAAAPLAYETQWLLEEVSTSINTTAAGGNASLMMIG